MSILIIKTAAEHLADNTLLTQNQIGVESDTGLTKTGYGNWNDLDYNTPNPDAFEQVLSGLKYKVPSSYAVQQAIGAIVPGGEDLAATLAIGNTTGANDIIVDDSTRLLIQHDVFPYTYTNSITFDKVAGGIRVSAFKSTGEESLVTLTQFAAQLYSTDGVNTTVLEEAGIYLTINSDYDFFAGVQYNADYSANYTDRSLIDRGYGNATYAPISVTPYTDEMAQDAVGNAIGNGLDYDDGTGAISVDESELGLTPTAVKTSAYNAVVGDLIPCNTTGGGFSITLPTAPVDKAKIQIKIVATGGTSNVIQVVTGGTDVFNKTGGNTIVYMSILGEVHTLQYNASGGIWYNVLTAPPSNFATNFPGIDATTPIPVSAISFDYVTLILTITPPLGYFRTFADGGGVITRTVHVGNLAFPAITNTTGWWYFYLDASGTPQSSQTDPDEETTAEIYSIYWNATLVGSARSILEIYECHDNSIPSIDHEWKHKYGTIWLNGFTNINNKIASGTPNADGRNAVIALTTGECLDDNLPYTITNGTGGGLFEQDLGDTTAATLNATNSAMIPIRYQDAGGLALVFTATRFPFSWDAGTNRPEYIDSVGTRTLVGASNYFVYYIFVTTDPRTGRAVKSISAPTEFTTLTNAQASSWQDIVNTYPVLSNEIRPLYKLTFQYQSGYNVGTKKTALRQVDDIRVAKVTSLSTLSGTLPASSVTNVPAGGISSTNVQAALDELDTEKQPLGNELTALQALADTVGFLKKTGDGSYSIDTNTYLTAITILNYCGFKVNIQSGDTITIPQYYQQLYSNELINDGELVSDGELIEI